MMDFNNFKEAVQFRITENESDYWVEDYWKAAIKIFTKNISDTIDFILNSCSDEEFFWLSEIFEDIAELTQSRDFVAALRLRLAKVTPENYHHENCKSKLMRDYINFGEYQRSIGEEIENAESRLEN